MPLHFRRATVADTAALAALVNAAYRGDSSRAGWTTEADLLGGQRTDAEKLGEMIAREDSRILIAIDEALLACVHLERKAAGTVYLGMLTVAPTSQAGGIGKQLLAHAEDFSRAEWGARTIEMTVIAVRAELIAWYERRGYSVTGERRPFPADDPRFGIPKMPLEFVVLQKEFASPQS
jgi:ribosomal protein S18 acetylase RimI-like enzyme